MPTNAKGGRCPSVSGIGVFSGILSARRPTAGAGAEKSSAVRRTSDTGVGGDVNRKRLGNRPAAVKLSSNPGCYSLIIFLKRKKTLRVGKLGVALFPKGTYVYTGSAMGGLAARLKRHLTREKKIRWHIDHLLKLPEARVGKVVVYPPAPNQECRQNRRIAALRGATVVLKRFGASDCKSGCASHLYLFAEESQSQLAAGRPVLPRLHFARGGTQILISSAR